MARYLRDRDASRLEQSMARLDQEQAAAETRERSDDIPADVAVRYVQDLPETWRKAEGGSGRQRLASALLIGSMFWRSKKRPSTSARTPSDTVSEQRYRQRSEYS
jgi:hypothetical protein